MSRAVCPWCQNPYVENEDGVLVCKNVDCKACAEEYLHAEIEKLRKDVAFANGELDYIQEQIEKDRTKDDLLECLIDAIESYVEFVDIMAFNTKISNLPEQFVRQTNTLCTRRKQHWQPILEELKNGRQATTVKTSHRDK